MKNKSAQYFLILSLFSLILGALFGMFASLQYLFPEFLKEIIPFNKMRPYHVTSVLSWIVLCATGSIYFYLTRIENLKLFSPKLAMVHFITFLVLGIIIYVTFFMGEMEGREYLAYSPILTIPILMGWFLFGLNYFKTLINKVNNWPVYYWMWGTGIVFMIFHLIEAHLWVFPYFKDSIIKDLSVQWKSYGSFIGSWNMLVYGLAIYVMSKIKDDQAVARGKLVFFFYFLGLVNLMFGWAHHTYIIPMQPWIRVVAYIISMTEWIILAHIILSWKRSLNQEQRFESSMTYRFLITADFWIFLNLFLALLLSIPAINFFTHGTHITVAHSMGTTIGINTTILLASVFFIVSKLNPEFNVKRFLIQKGYLLFKISLLFFWILLLVAGIKKSHWMYFSENVLFSEMQENQFIVYTGILIFGIGLTLALIMLAIPLLRNLFGKWNK
jgi:nitric oxide reductase subunit B